MVLSTLSDEDLARLKVADRLFELLRRKAFFRSDAEFVSSNLDATRSATLASVVNIVAGVAARELARKCETARMSGIETSGVLEIVGAMPVEQMLDVLTACADDHNAYQVDSSAVSAVVEAMLLLIARSTENRDHSESLCVAAAAAHDAGRSALLERVLRAADRAEHSPGYSALFLFYRAQLPSVRMKPAEFTRLRTQCRTQLLAVRTSDPANARARRILRWMDEHEAGRRKSATSRAATAAEAGNYVDAAHWYGLATGDAETPGHAGAYRLFSEIFKLRSGQLQTPDDFRSSMLRLSSDHVAKAKPLLPLDNIFADYSTAAAHTERDHPGSSIAAQVVDFIGDVRMGVALDHHSADLGTVARSLTDISIVDALQRDPQLISMADLKTAMPGASFVWVEILHDNDDPSDPALSGDHLRVITVTAGSESCVVRDISLTHEQADVVRGTLNEASETADPGDIAWLGGTVFGNLRPTDDARGICVIPDSTSWEFPWMRIVPEFVDQFAVVPSAASAMRLRPPGPADRRRVVSFFNPDMKGAGAEHATLLELHREHRIEYRPATDLAGLATLLTGAEVDLLCIGAHGSFSAGAEFEMDFGSERVPLLDLLELPLPSVVNLGCCWSGRTSLANNSIAASLAAISGGASLVLGGIWEIDDESSGTLMSHAYRLYADNHSFAQAVLAAARQLDTASAPTTGALCLFGRW